MKYGADYYLTHPELQGFNACMFRVCGLHDERSAVTAFQVKYAADDVTQAAHGAFF